MARKGSVKVRTGCITCRIRKIKCDEAKPHCDRCTRTGRKCDGYKDAETSSITHQPRRLFPACTQPSEARALHFFRARVAAGLSGPYDSYFWTDLVLQLSNSEPIVRHALVAISSLYENLSCRDNDLGKLKSNEFALAHYNTAVRSLREVRHEPLVLLACLLFICIEVVQENRAQAVIHCQHGVAILESIRSTALWSQSYLAPIFRRLSTMPIFFGGIGTPRLIPPQFVPSGFASFEEANYFIEDAVGRTMDLSRYGDSYRYGASYGQEVSPGLVKMQAELLQSIGRLRPALSKFKRQIIAHQRPLSEEEEVWLLLFNVRIEICHIWTSGTLDPSEEVYDRLLNNFRHLTQLCKNLSQKLQPRIDTLGPEFRLEIGYLVLVHLVGTKCRDLRLRLEGLQLVKTYGAVREAFWDAQKMYKCDRRIIEIEHNLTLDEFDQPVGDFSWDDIPPDSLRVRDTTFDQNLVICGEVGGKPVTGHPLAFIKRDAEGNLFRQCELVYVDAVSQEKPPVTIAGKNAIQLTA
ncbi:hypothetical protein GQ53DRAFT_664030 [Thozetella sp. PMI_491]|nr:hypothetical protein GQ53DRAFT_664030 [Thozetella sp. PMI_491]